MSHTWLLFGGRTDIMRVLCWQPGGCSTKAWERACLWPYEPCFRYRLRGRWSWGGGLAKYFSDSVHRIALASKKRDYHLEVDLCLKQIDSYLSVASPDVFPTGVATLQLPAARTESYTETSMRCWWTGTTWLRDILAGPRYTRYRTTGQGQDLGELQRRFREPERTSCLRLPWKYGQLNTIL